MANLTRFWQRSTRAFACTVSAPIKFRVRRSLELWWIIVAPGPIVPREAKKDTVLNISDNNGTRTLLIKKGTHVSHPWPDFGRIF